MTDPEPDDSIRFSGSAVDNGKVYQVGRGNLHVDASVHYHGRSRPTPAEEIASTRAPLWEYLLFAAILREETSSLEGKWIGYCYGYTVAAARYTSEKAAIDRFNQFISESSRIATSLTSLLDLRLQERAFGRPGEAGNREAIIHLARHASSLLAQWLDSAIELRSIGVPSRLERLRVLSVQISDKAIRDVYAFIQRIIREFENLPNLVAAHATGEPIVVELTLALTVDHVTTKQHRKELRKLGRPRS